MDRKSLYCKINTDACLFCKAYVDIDPAPCGVYEAAGLVGGHKPHAAHQGGVALGLESSCHASMDVDADGPCSPTLIYNLT